MNGTARRRGPILKNIETLAIVAQALNLQAAARRLNVTPSAVSRRIKAMEDAVGLALFQRTATDILLTVAGMALLRDAGAVVRMAEDDVARILEPPKTPDWAYSQPPR